MSFVNSPVGSATIALLLLSASVAIIGKFYSSVSSEVTTLIIYAGGFVGVGLVALLAAKTEGTVLTYPSIWGAIVIAVCGIMLGYGDFFSFRSLNMGGTVLLVATVLALVPVVSGVFMLVLGADAPSLRQCAAVGFAIVSAILYRSDPSLQKQPEPKPAPVTAEVRP